MPPINQPFGQTLPERVATATENWKHIARALLASQGGWLSYPDLLDKLGLSSHQLGGILGGQKFTNSESPIRQTLEDGRWYVLIAPEDWSWVRGAVA